MPAARLAMLATVIPLLQLNDLFPVPPAAVTLMLPLLLPWQVTWAMLLVKVIAAGAVIVNVFEAVQPAASVAVTT